jgi:hypothetical protein
MRLHACTCLLVLLGTGDLDMVACMYISSFPIPRGPGIITEPVYHDCAGSTNNPRPGPPRHGHRRDSGIVGTHTPRALDEEKQGVSPRWNCPLF